MTVDTEFPARGYFGAVIGTESFFVVVPLGLQKKRPDPDVTSHPGFFPLATHCSVAGTGHIAIYSSSCGAAKRFNPHRRAELPPSRKLNTSPLIFGSLRMRCIMSVAVNFSPRFAVFCYTIQ